MKLILRRLSSRGINLIVVCLIAFLGGAAAIYSSTNGPWGNQDAASYIISARNLMRGIGLGYYLPNGQFYVWTVKPPLFSLALAAIGRLGVDLVDAARWLNVLLFMGTIILAGLIVIRFSSSPSLSIPVSLLLVSFPTMVRMYSSSMSEPLFIFLLVMSVYFLIGLFRFGTKGWLILAAVFTSLLPMTRYIGVAMLPVGVVCTLLFLSGSWKERLKKTFVMGILSSLPIILWVTWIYFFVDQSFAGRVIELDREALSGNFIRFYSAITQYVLSWIPLGLNIWEMRFRWRYGLIFLVLGIVIAATLLAMRQSRKRLSFEMSDNDFQMFGVWGLWMVSYLAFLAVDSVIATPNPPITNRIMLPFFFGMAMGLMAALACWRKAWFKGGWRWLQVVPWIIGIGAFFWYLPTTYAEVILPLHTQTGMISYQGRSSETMAAARALPKDVVIVSNDAYKIWVWADRPAYDVMENLQETFINRDTPYGSDLSDQAQKAFRTQGAALVIFRDEFSNQLEAVYGMTGRARVDTFFKGLVLAGKYADGEIYYFPR